RAKPPSSGWWRFPSSSEMTTSGSTTSSPPKRVIARGSARSTEVSRTYALRAIGFEVVTEDLVLLRLAVVAGTLCAVEADCAATAVCAAKALCAAKGLCDLGDEGGGDGAARVRLMPPLSVSALVVRVRVTTASGEGFSAGRRDLVDVDC